MKIDSKSQEKVISLLKERHLLYTGLSRERAERDPYWFYKHSLSKNDYLEWVEFGVNSIMSVAKIDRRNAEVEMAWLEGTYGIKVK